MFPTNSTASEIENHHSSHYGRSCPLCSIVFRRDYPQVEFEQHVNRHFAN
jgi:uncharacterized C2H2 Zn-finger protein